MGRVGGAEDVVVRVHDFVAPEGGVDLPSATGSLEPVGHLVDIPLVLGTQRVRVTVQVSRIVSPLGKTPRFAIFLDDEPGVIGPVNGDGKLTLPWTDVDDTTQITVKWQSAPGVTNRLAEDERTRVIISMDIGTRGPGPRGGEGNGIEGTS